MHYDLVHVVSGVVSVATADIVHCAVVSVTYVVVSSGHCSRVQTVFRVVSRCFNHAATTSHPITSG